MPYRVKLDGNEYAPANFGEIKIALELNTDSGGYFFRRVLSDAMKFYKDAYSYIYTQISISQCQKVEVEIEQFCNGAWESILVGFFTRHDCTIFLDRCVIEANIEVEDDYSCILKNAATKINFLAADSGILPPTDFQYLPVYGLEVLAVPATPPCGFYTDWGNPYSLGGYTSAWGNTYCIYARYVTRVNCVAGVLQPPPPAFSTWNLLSDECAINGTATYWREAAATEILLVFSDIQCLGGGCTPAACGQFCIDAGVFPNAIPLGAERICACPVWTTYTIPNGRELPLVFEYILSQICPDLTFASELLTNDTNPVTGNPLNPLKPSYIFQKSDVANPTFNNWATVGEISLLDLLDDFCKLPNAAWDVQSGVLRLEHITGILSNTVGTDLTVLDGGKWARARNTISFDKPSVPKQESFTYAIDAVQQDFAGLPIVYDIDCSTDTKNETRTQYIETEIVRIFNNPNEGRDGFVVIAAGSINQDDFKAENGELSGLFVPNAPYAWANLHRDYFLDYRYLIEGELNGAPTTFNSTRPIKKQEGLVFPVCCLNEFDPLQLVKTEIGEGRVVAAEYDVKSQMMTVTIKFEDL